ncbi:hypothetical protein DTW90_36170 [Neorhizobium sp. P12A]|nr:hypothetical protein DTW90_36170 [Neorhizobium sp. P12A]
MKEALAVASGEEPAASILWNGQRYYPESEILRLRALAYCDTNKGPMLWKDIADDAFWKIEHLRRVEIRKLASRIQKQRECLRWWEKLFHQHVHSHWRKAQPEYFRIVRRDMRLVAASARKAALEEAAKVADEYMLAAEHAGSAPMSIGAKGIAAFIRLLKVEEPKG